MFLSEKNQQILIDLNVQFNLNKENIPNLMKKYYVNANKSLSLLEMNKHFLLTLEDVCEKNVENVANVENVKVENVKVENVKIVTEKNENVEPELHPNSELIFLEISLIKQELNEIKKMLVVVPQLFNNFSVAKNTDLG
jgi:hypothetical protein